jgi:hypothetical protein
MHQTAVEPLLDKIGIEYSPGNKYKTGAKAVQKSFQPVNI